MINIRNFEHTKLQNDQFPFNCFYIYNSNTLSHWHNHIEIIYVSKGTCEIYINGTLYLGNTDDIILTPPNSLHSILPRDHSSYYALVIGKALLRVLADEYHINTILTPFLYNSELTPLHIQPNSKGFTPILSSLKEIINESKEKNDYFESMIKIELCRFFTLLMRNHSVKSHLKNNEFASRTHCLKIVIEYLSVHYQEKISISDMSKLINVSEQHFCRLFKSYTGKTFIEYLTLLRLEHAHEFLINTDLTITEITELTGFCNPNYFSRIYKKYYKQSPSTTRKNFKNSY